jgi:hypothetical protein
MRTFLVVLLTLAVVGAAYGADPLDIRASIWSYKSICGFDDPPGSSQFTIKYQSNYSVVIEGCTGQERKLGHPPAVRVAVKNFSQTEVGLPVPNLDAVTVTARSGKAVQALARRELVRGPFEGTMMSFVSETKGDYSIVLKPGQQADLIFLFAAAAPGEIIKLGEMKPLTIK